MASVEKEDEMNIKIRRAKNKDINSVYILGEQVDELKFSNKNFHEKFELKHFLKGKDNIFLVAEIDKKVEGFLYAKIISKDWCMLDNLVVSKKFRNNGMGSQLLEELYKLLKKMKVDYIQVIEDVTKKKTREFWRNKGFKEQKVFVWADKILK